LTAAAALRNLAALCLHRQAFIFQRFGADSHEAHLPAKQDQAQADPRVPRPHGDQEGPPGPEAPTRQGPQTPGRYRTSLTSDPTSGRAGLRAGQKLSTAAEFERARKSQHRQADSLFSIQWIENSRECARIGMAVGVRAVGAAVTRNRVRRLIRESFRLRRQELPAVDIFVIARSGTRSASNAQIFTSLARLWQGIRSA
jgi:ribonuclease P protein component